MGYTERPWCWWFIFLYFMFFMFFITHKTTVCESNLSIFFLYFVPLTFYNQYSTKVYVEYWKLKIAYTSTAAEIGLLSSPIGWMGSNSPMGDSLSTINGFLQNLSLVHNVMCFFFFLICKTLAYFNHQSKVIDFVKTHWATIGHHPWACWSPSSPLEWVAKTVLFNSTTKINRKKRPKFEVLFYIKIELS